jgi:plasmid maintenance system antidote protein VapI
VDDARTHLAEVMNRRRQQLGWKWIDVAREAHMSVQNLLRIRQGEIAITDDAARQLEQALRWETGSVNAVLNNRDPILSEPAQQPRQANVTPSDPSAGRRALPSFADVLNHLQSAYALGGDTYGWRALHLMADLDTASKAESNQNGNTGRSA